MKSCNTDRKIKEIHKEQLKKCCRVCGKRWKTAKRSFSCIWSSRRLQETFKVDISEEDMEFMASRILFCFQGVIRRTIHAYKKRVPYCANTTNNHFQFNGVEIKENVR